MSKNVISPLHIILLIMTAIGLKNHVTIIPPILHFAGRDSWISVLLTTFVMIPWLLLLVYIHKKTNQQDMTILIKNKIGKVFYYCVFSLISLYVIYGAAFSIRETIQWMNSTFLMETPISIMIIIYAILCVLLAVAGLETIIIANVFVLFFVIVFGFFVAIVNIQVKDYTLIFPMLENGFSSIGKGMIYPASGLIELTLLVFIQHRFKGKLLFKHYLMMVIILLWLTLGPLIGAIIEFGPVEASKQRFPAYEEWGLVTIGRFIEHIDFLSIYQWIGGAFIRIGFLLYVSFHLLQINKKPKWIWGLVTPLFISMSLLLTRIEDQEYFILKRTTLLPSTFYILLFISVSLFVFVSVAYRKSGRTSS